MKLKNTKGLKAKTRRNKIGKVILASLVILTLCIIYYISNNKQLLNFRGKSQPKAASNVNTKEREIDCARKLTQKNFSYNDMLSSDCLFMGCGDFF